MLQRQTDTKHRNQNKLVVYIPIYIFNPYSSSSYTFLLFQTSFYNEGSGGQSQKGIGVLKQTSSIGGINFTAHSGDIDSLSLKTYGLRVDS